MNPKNFHLNCFSSPKKRSFGWLKFSKWRWYMFVIFGFSNYPRWKRRKFTSFYHPERGWINFSNPALILHHRNLVLRNVTLSFYVTTSHISLPAIWLVTTFVVPEQTQKRTCTFQVKESLATTIEIKVSKVAQKIYIYIYTRA